MSGPMDCRRGTTKARPWNMLFPTTIIVATAFLIWLIVPLLLSGTTLDLSAVSSPSSEVAQENDDHVADIPTEKNDNDLTIRLNAADHAHRKPQTIKLEWNITKAERRPDGVAKQVYLINNQYPAPLIEARSGDQIFITVNNLIQSDEGVAIHWHGLHVSNDVDGAAGVTQCSITPNHVYTYTLQIPDYQAGTFWYHAHFETQRADGLFGPIVIHQPAEFGKTEADEVNYEEDQVLMIGDWYHRTADVVLASYDTYKNFKIEPVPDSMLLNGKGGYNCSMAVPARPLDCHEIEVPTLRLNSARTRLRIVNTGASTGFSMSLTGYSIHLITVDGNGHVASNSAVEAIGVLYPGERMDLVVEKVGLKEDETARLTVALDHESMHFPNLALKSLQHFPVLSSIPHTSHKKRQPTNGQKLDLVTINGTELTAGVLPTTAEETVLLYANIAYLSRLGNHPKGMINNTYWQPPNNITDLPLLAHDRADWAVKPELFVPNVTEGNWVDLIINNVDDKGHPFHLHGHDFYVLATYHAQRLGEYAAYNPYAAPAGELPGQTKINHKTPVRKDTIYVPSQGFVMVRFKAERLGIWLLHCHVLWHQSVGMGTAIQIGGASQLHEQFGESAKQSCHSDTA
ncbi:multicopper oxidase [Acrodontium crateriforme]|uniref:Multicopper oxidase n=1 Tax=Acrodontium crateriforme TaxID=150365 RepID=A0AAQ3R7T2_9PEZI|nr:multicopper oxidase [Acrodontium crateriforme]